MTASDEYKSWEKTHTHIHRVAHTFKTTLQATVKTYCLKENMAIQLDWGPLTALYTNVVIQ